MLNNDSYIFSLEPPQTYVLSFRVSAPSEVKAHHRYIMRQEVMNSIEGFHPAGRVAMHVDDTRQLLPLSLFFVGLKMRANYF